MKLCNNTPNAVTYWISSAGSADCGSLESQQTTDVSWDNQANVKVSFSALPPEPSGVTPFSVTIPNSGTGMAVTIGLYQE